MVDIEIIEVFDHLLIKVVVSLAKRIWTQHYPAIVGKPQVDYMLAKFQSQDAIARQLRQEGYRYFLVKKTTEHIGYFAVIPKRDTKVLFISKYYVLSDQRGKGHGRTIMVFIESMARQMKFDKILLTVNKENTLAIRAYEGMGFKNSGSRVTDIGSGFFMDDYVMEKSVKIVPARKFSTRRS